MYTYVDLEHFFLQIMRMYVTPSGEGLASTFSPLFYRVCLRLVVVMCVEVFACVIRGGCWAVDGVVGCWLEVGSGLHASGPLQTFVTRRTACRHLFFSCLDDLLHSVGPNDLVCSWSIPSVDDALLEGLRLSVRWISAKVVSAAMFTA